MLGNLGYQSEWTDVGTGRVNMRTRWYNTDTGQFDTRDTVEQRARSRTRSTPTGTSTPRTTR